MCKPPPLPQLRGLMWIFPSFSLGLCERNHKCTEVYSSCFLYHGKFPMSIHEISFLLQNWYVHRFCNISSSHSSELCFK